MMRAHPIVVCLVVGSLCTLGYGHQEKRTFRERNKIYCRKILPLACVLFYCPRLAPVAILSAENADAYDARARDILLTFCAIVFICYCYFVVWFCFVLMMYMPGRTQLHGICRSKNKYNGEKPHRRQNKQD